MRNRILALAVTLAVVGLAGATRRSRRPLHRRAGPT